MHIALPPLRLVTVHWPIDFISAFCVPTGNLILERFKISRNYFVFKLYLYCTVTTYRFSTHFSWFSLHFYVVSLLLTFYAGDIFLKTLILSWKLQFCLLLFLISGSCGPTFWDVCIIYIFVAVLIYFSPLIHTIMNCHISPIRSGGVSCEFQ
jgi:hypothetical protein